MEGNYLTSGDLALMENHRGGYGYGYGDFYGGCCGHGRGMAATGIGLAAGLGGGALIGLFALAYGLNSASKARARAAENAAAGNARSIDLLASQMICERNSREGWQNLHQPSMVQYVSASSQSGAGAGANAASNALASAEALALNALLNNNGHNGQTCPQPVALYQPAMPCRCNTCGD